MLLTSVALLVVAAAEPPKSLTEVPFRVAECAIVVDATVNGRAVPLVFDSGFGGWVEVADTVDIGEKTGSGRMKGFVSPIDEDTVKLKSLKIGPRSIPIGDNEIAYQTDAWSSESARYNAHVDGLLGLQPFLGQPVEINFQKRVFVFHPKSMDISKRVPDNKRTFLLKMLPAGFECMMLEVQTKHGQKIHMAVDTGNWFYAVTYRETLERIGAWEAGRKPKFFRSNENPLGSVANWTKKLTDMTIYGVPVPVSYWDVIELPSVELGQDGTIGFGFLSNFNVTFDFDRRRVWLENYTGKVGNDEPGDVGLFFYVKQHFKRVTVADVLPDSPADKAGIERGDQLVAIDGKDLPPAIGVLELRRRMEGPVGSKVKLEFRRDDRVISVELERISLVND